MKWADFNDLLWSSYKWDGETVDYRIKCPALDISYDAGGLCKQCNNFTSDVMVHPPYGANNLFVVTYTLLKPKPRICSRGCLFNYICSHYAEILEELTK